MDFSFLLFVFRFLYLVTKNKKSSILNNNMEQEKHNWKKNPFAKAAVEFIRKIVEDPEYVPDDSSIVYAFYIPSTDLLPTLYESFGASSFYDLFPSSSDIDKYLEIVYMDRYEANRTILKELKIESKEILEKDVHIVYVSGMYFNEKFTEEDLKNIVSGKKNTTGQEFLKLPNDIFNYMVSIGEISGKDLIGLCLGNAGIMEKCNNRIFIEQLRKEFGLNYADVDAEISPFEIYSKLYRIRENLDVVIREKKKVNIKARCSSFNAMTEGKCKRLATGFNKTGEPCCNMHGARRIVINTVYDLMYSENGYFPEPFDKETSKDDLYEFLLNKYSSRWQPYRKKSNIIETILAIHRLVQVGIIGETMSIEALAEFVHEE